MLKRIWEMGKGRGQKMTVQNASKIVRKIGFNAWLPIQTGVSEWMGDTKVYRVKESLITDEQIASLKLEPGDIMLERRDWYLSNIGCPASGRTRPSTSAPSRTSQILRRSRSQSLGKETRRRVRRSGNSPPPHLQRRLLMDR
jgi:hypothetical protein